MSNAEKQAADVQGPQGNAVFCFATTAASAVRDLTSQNLEGKFVRIVCGVDLYYRWDPAAGGTADETAVIGTNDANQVQFLPAGTIVEEYPTGGYFVHKAAAAGTVRISVASKL